ncbi:MAG: hypothetical protein F4Z05_15015 [Chloroflexi bacterium]|nr:hypothetical protein [Chloroflexota bacterium]
MFAVNTRAPSQRRIAEPRSDIYHDTGCEVAGSCLQCPLSRCKFDDMEWFIRYRRMAHDLRMAAIIHGEGLSVAQAAERFSITTRTVFRVLRRCRYAMCELTPEEAAVFASLAA